MKYYQLSFGVGDPRTYTGLNATFLFFVRMTDGVTIAPPSISEVMTGSGLYQFQYGTTQPISFLADGATSSVSSARYVRGLLDPADRSDEYGTTLVAIGTSHFAQGTTMIALGTSIIAQGTTMIAIGTTNIALGTTNVALGTSNVALGTTNVALGITNAGYGLSNIALGTSMIALGTSIYAQGLSLTVTVSGLGSAGSTIGGSSTDPVDVFGYNKRIMEFLEGNSAFDKSSGSWNIYSRGFTTLLRTKSLSNNASGITKS